MTRPRLAATVSWASACGFFVVAALHGSAYGRIMVMAEPAPETIRRVVSVLWLSGSADLVALGLVVAAMAHSSGAVGALVIALAALCPLAVAGRHVVFLGFLPPTAMLLALAALTLGAAFLKKSA